MAPPNDAIVPDNPQLGADLAVTAVDGSEIDCGKVVACGYLQVNRGGSGSQIVATMIWVRTTNFPNGFKAYPGPSVRMPEPYSYDHQRRL